VLNVGGNSKAMPLPPPYENCEHLLLDIDPAGKPDIVCDARNLSVLAGGGMDVIYCSHNLEHYYAHEVPRVLAGFMHVLKADGWAHIRVPDLNAVMRRAVEQRLDVDDALYSSLAGPIKLLDVLYGYGAEIERSGNDFFAHKTGFTQRSLTKCLQTAGFAQIFSVTRNFEVEALASKGAASPLMRQLFGLPEAA
jgi:hypothetical protein